jgi:hypothetical protein
MNMTDSNPLVDGLLMIHRIISRGLTVSLRKCDEYRGKQGVPPEEAAGFSLYVSTLKLVTHAHHLSEDEIAFPYFKELIEAPYNRLMEDHLNISHILDKFDKCLSDISSDGLGTLHEVLDEFNKTWIPHIKIEEENFTAQKLQQVAEMKEQVNMAQKLASHGSKNAGPGPLAVPFMIYNLEGRDREAFMKLFPMIVKKVLVPIIWKGQWKPMIPFFL